MPYLALFFDVEAADADRWADALLDAGALSVDVADPHAGTEAEEPRYAEAGEPAEPYWPVSRVTALFATESNAVAALGASAARLGQTPPPHQSRTVADEDWVRATQAQFAPIRVAERLWIVPSWCAPPEADAVNIALDPGLAFGTGSHPTTRLCLEWLAGAMPKGARVLDYGCGSGILAIAATMLGAGIVTGVDIDPQAIVASRANARANGVDATFIHADELAARPDDRFDVVVANILARPLIVLAPSLAQRVREGGHIVLSGVLVEQADAVAAAYAPWFRIAVRAIEDDWVALAGVREHG